jgi:hypothetical protein
MNCEKSSRVVSGIPDDGSYRTTVILTFETEVQYYFYYLLRYGGVGGGGHCKPVLKFYNYLWGLGIE